eukprot:SAG22_NODE_484_length_9912_cov_23.425150_5_plen_402_part_00
MVAMQFKLFLCSKRDFSVSKSVLHDDLLDRGVSESYQWHLRWAKTCAAGACRPGRAGGGALATRSSHGAAQMSAIDFERMRAQMRAEAAAARAAKQAAAAAPAEPAAGSPGTSSCSGTQPQPQPQPAAEAGAGAGSDAGAAAAPDPLVVSIAPRPAAGRAVLRYPYADGRFSAALAEPAAEQPQQALDTVSYLPEFVSREEAAGLMRALDSPAGQARWLGVRAPAGRRNQNWGGRPGDLKLAEPLPPFAVSLIDAVMAAGLYEPEHRPNHVLINEYGRAAGLNAHTDGPLYYPRVACLSLGGPAAMALWHCFEDATAAQEHAAGERADGGPGPLAQIFLQPRSLNVLSGTVYRDVMHGIDATEVDTVSEACLNAAACGLRPGETTARQDRRISIVLVHKLV